MNGTAHDEIDTAAAQWVARMDSDHWSEDDDVALGRWLAKDRRHRGALLQAQALWMRLEEDLSDGEFEIDEGRRMLGLSRRRWLAGAGISLAASIAGAFFFLGGATDYETTIGEIRRVPLADGSTAAINTNSRISVRLEKSARSVTLEQGEAWFQVAKDPSRPFRVDAGKVRVQAVGTAFSVRRRGAGAEVIVTEGHVVVWTAQAEGRKIGLFAGQAAFVADDAAIRRPPAGTTAERSLAWRAGKIDLAGTRLDEAIAEFNRYNHRLLQLGAPALASERLDGVFRTDDPEGFAKVVAGSLGGEVDLSDPDTIVIRAR